MNPTTAATLAAIRSYHAEHGVMPSLRDIGRMVGISSTSVVSYNLAELERQGYIKTIPRIARGIVLTPKQEAGQ